MGGSAPKQDAPASSVPESDGLLQLDKLDVEQLPYEPRAPAFGMWDVFFWRDTPDWYYKTFTSAAFMLSYSAMRQYLDRHELEVFLPPRAKILPESMRRGYRNREILQAALYKCGKQTVTAAAVSGVYFGGAYYLGQYLGRYKWTDFTTSGCVAGTALALGLIQPPKIRPVAFGAALGAALGSVSGLALQALDVPFWDESRDFQGWWWGRWVDRKAAKRQAALEQQQAQDAAGVVGQMAKPAVAAGGSS